jgi:hypothetical protein
MLFENWWEEEGRFIDPDTSDVPWFDKRKELAGLAFVAASQALTEENARLRQLLTDRSADCDALKAAADLAIGERKFLQHECERYHAEDIQKIAELKSRLSRAIAALHQAHSCATIDFITGKCEGCVVSEVLAELEK